MKHPFYSEIFYFISVAVVFLITVSGSSGTIQARQSPPKTVKMYLQMSEDEQKQFVAKEAESVSFAIGNNAGFAVGEKITPEAVAAVKPFVDAYAKRADTPKSPQICRLGRDNLSDVLHRWWKNQEIIDSAFKTPLPDDPNELKRLGIAPDNLKHFTWRIGNYLAMAQSEFCPCLQSPTGLKGMFQLTRRDVSTYSLQSSDKPIAAVDVRCNTEKAAIIASLKLRAIESSESPDSKSQVPAALIYFVSGKIDGINAKDNFWTFVTRSESANEKSTAQSVNSRFVLKLIAAAIVIENAELFVNDLPPEASRAARSKKLDDEIVSDFKNGMLQLILTIGFLEFLENPQSDFAGDVKKSLTTEEIKKYFPNYSDDNSRTLNTQQFAELRMAPEWLKKFVRDLHTFHPAIITFPLQIIKYQYNNQTVYNLTENAPKDRDDRTPGAMSFVYDENGKTVCGKYLAKSNFEQNCPDFFSARKDGKLVWEDVVKLRKKSN